MIDFVPINYLGEFQEPLLIFLAVLVVLKVFNVLFLQKLKNLAKITKNEFDDVFIEYIEEIQWSFIFFIALYLAAKSLSLADNIHRVLDKMLFVFFVFYAVKAIIKLTDFFVKREIRKRKENEIEATSSLQVLNLLVKIAVFTIALLLILSNLGINITSLLAGLGIGGIAIAFALQKILEDIFSSFSIYFDKPFKEGDYIVIGNDSGTVKHIGLKTTRIRHLEGQELVVSNRELTSTRIHNYKRMKKRRVVFTFGVEYPTSSAKLKKIPDIVKSIITKIKNLEFERVHFKEFGDFALIFEVVYHVGTREFGVYRDVQQTINLELKEAFEKEKIEFAFPTQTIHLKK